MSGFGENRARREVPLFTTKQEFIKLLQSVFDPNDVISLGPQGFVVNVDSESLVKITGSPRRIAARAGTGIVIDEGISATGAAVGSASLTTTATGYPYALGVLNW